MNESHTLTNSYLYRFIYLMLCLSFLINFHSFGKVDPPNYDFTLDKFKTLEIGAELQVDKNIFKNESILMQKGDFTILRYDIVHQRYKFPVFLKYTTKNNKRIITDYFIKLPNYFLHDVFYQSLINRHGKISNFFHFEGNSIYEWNKKNFKLTYSGTCTITCFPLYLAAVNTESEHNFLEMWEEGKLN